MTEGEFVAVLCQKDDKRWVEAFHKECLPTTRETIEAGTFVVKVSDVAFMDADRPCTGCSGTIFKGW
jgi:hypothetical protein